MLSIVNSQPEPIQEHRPMNPNREAAQFAPALEKPPLKRPAFLNAVQWPARTKDEASPLTRWIAKGPN
jgi:hypothetical protein